MTLRHLEILEAVAQTGTFTGAAEKLYITQSAVSHAVAELEQMTGTILFDRLSRGVRPTRCGALLLEDAHRLLASCRELEERMGNLEEQAPVKLVSSITIASFFLPALLRRLRGQAPALKVQVQVVSAGRAMEVLQAGDADLALVEGAAPQGPFLVSPFGAYELLAACAPGFSLPTQTWDAGALCALPLLLREQGSAIRDTLDSALYLAGQKAYPVWESVNSQALIEAAAAGLGVTVLPDLLLAAPVEAGRLRLLPLAGPPLKNQLLAVCRRDQYRTDGANRLLEAVKTAAPLLSADSRLFFDKNQPEILKISI